MKKAKSKAGFSLPWLTIILIIVIAAALIWGKWCTWVGEKLV